MKRYILTVQYRKIGYVRKEDGMRFIIRTDSAMNDWAGDIASLILHQLRQRLLIANLRLA